MFYVAKPSRTNQLLLNLRKSQHRKPVHLIDVGSLQPLHLLTSVRLSILAAWVALSHTGLPLGIVCTGSDSTSPRCWCQNCMS